MSGSITMVPDKDGKITVHCDGQDIVITIASPGSQTMTRNDDSDPFSKWNRNIQLMANLPDGEFSLQTADSERRVTELLQTRTSQGAHVIRVQQGANINLHAMHKISQDSERNVHILFVPKA
jgi:2-oxoglutarate dehydrogenase complex dehydrogenase (E1) component-like enzyme